MKIGKLAPPAAAALLGAALLTALLAACAAPPDEAWLRILGFVPAGSGSSAEAISSVDATLDDPPTTTAVNASLANQAGLPGTDASVGISVYATHIEYSLAGAPTYDFPLTLYLLPAHGISTAGGSTGVIEVPVVPAPLKGWIRDNVFIPTGGLAMTARVTFKARTDEGRDLASTGGLLVNIVNEPFSPSARARF